MSARSQPNGMHKVTSSHPWGSRCREGPGHLVNIPTRSPVFGPRSPILTAITPAAQMTSVGPQKQSAHAPQPRVQTRLRREHLDLLLLALPFAVGVALTFCTTTDDPFITLRYAANVVHGHGPVFNIGQPPVEGFSSPLGLLAVIVAYLIPGAHSLLMIKLFSLFFGILTLGAARRLIYGMEMPAWGKSLACLLTGGSWILAVASSNGLETTLAALLTTLLIGHLVSGTALVRPGRTGLIAIGLVLVRPEGIGMVLILAVGAFLFAPGPGRRRRSVTWVLWPLGGEVAVTVARLLYYGEPLANTYYAKHVPLSRAIPDGESYLRSVLFLNKTGFHLSHDLSFGLSILALISFVLLVVGLVALTVGRDSRVLIPLAVLAQCGFTLISGGDWMTGGRFLAPVAPLLAVTAAAGVVTVVGIASRLPGQRGRAVNVLEGVLVAMMGAAAIIPVLSVRDPVWSSHGRFDTADLFAASDGGGFYPAVWLAGDRALACARPNSVIAYSEVGYAGFTHLDLRFIDTRGLTDRAIARNSPTQVRNYFGVADPDWYSTTSTVGSEILAQHVDLILTFDSGPERGILGGRFIEVGSKVVPPSGVTLHLYRRVGIACSPPGFQAPSVGDTSAASAATAGGASENLPSETAVAAPVLDRS